MRGTLLFFPLAILLGHAAWAQSGSAPIGSFNGTANYGHGNTDPRAVTAPSDPIPPARPIEAVGQGAQDPARSEVLEGRSRDMTKCMNTLLARRESAQEARQVCDKILAGVGE